MVKGFVGGLVAAAIGAAVWALISWLTDYEIAWIAIGIGALVGAGVRLGGSSTSAGVTAVLLTGLSIAAGKYGAVALDIDKAFGGEFSFGAIEAETRSHLGSETGMLEALADEIAWQREEDGEVLDWPSGMSYQTAFALHEYPDDVQAAARERISGMSPEDRRAYIQTSVAEAESEWEAFLAEGGMASIRSDAFMYQWGGFDVIFVGFAGLAAFGVASGRSTDGAEE